MKKFYLIDSKIPVKTESFSNGSFLCLGLTLIGWRLVMDFYDMVTVGSCRSDDFRKCEEVTEEEFEAAIVARVEWFAERGHTVYA